MIPKKSVSQALKIFKENTAAKNGMECILKGKSKKSKAMWLILFLTSSSVLIYELQKILKSYSARSVLISLQKKEKDLMRFPTLTICQSSILSRSALEMEQFAFSDPAATGEYLAYDNLLALRALLAAKYFHFFSTLEEVTKAIMNPQKLFLTQLKSSCIFGIHSHCKYPQNVTTLVTSSYAGLCFQLNSKGTVKQRDAGHLYGLSLILFVNQSDYVPFSTFDYGSGIMLKIHEADEYPFPDFDSIPVSPGFLTRISLKKMRYSRLKNPYPSNCTDGENIKLYYPGKYTISNCKRSCMVRDNLEDCGSTDPLTMMMLNQTGKHKYTKLNESTLTCIHKSAGKSTSDDQRKCLCPIPCKEVTYIPTISQSRWPSKADLPYYKYIFARALGLDHLRIKDEFIYDNFIKLNIFYDEMSYMEISEKSEWNLEKLISDIGGQMGVWIGASILSLFQLVLSILTSIKRFIFKKKKSRIIEVQEYNIKKPSNVSEK